MINAYVPNPGKSHWVIFGSCTFVELIGYLYLHCKFIPTYIINLWPLGLGDFLRRDRHNSDEDADFESGTDSDEDYFEIRDNVQQQQQWQEKAHDELEKWTHDGEDLLDG